MWTNLLTYSMEQNPLWQANQFSTSEEIPCIIWNPKVNYHNFKIPPPAPIPSQINPVHAPLTQVVKIYLNIIPHLCLGFPSGLFPFRFPHQNPACISPIPHMCYMPYLSHSFGKEYWSLCSSLCSFLLSPVTSSLSGPHSHLSTLFSIHTWKRGFWSSRHWFHNSCVGTEEA